MGSSGTMGGSGSMGSSGNAGSSGAMVSSGSMGKSGGMGGNGTTIMGSMTGRIGAGSRTPGRFSHGKTMTKKTTRLGARGGEAQIGVKGKIRKSVFDSPIFRPRN